MKIMDPNVAKMIERSRARTSAKKGASKASAGENTAEQIAMKTLSPQRKVPINVEKRSPLKPRNFEDASSSSSLSSPSKARKKEVEVTDSPSDTIKRMLSRDSLETSVQELLSRLEERRLVHVQYTNV